MNHITKSLPAMILQRLDKGRLNSGGLIGEVDRACRAQARLDKVTGVTASVTLSTERAYVTAPALIPARGPIRRGRCQWRPCWTVVRLGQARAQVTRSSGSPSAALASSALAGPRSMYATPTAMTAPVTGPIR